MFILFSALVVERTTTAFTSTATPNVTTKFSLSAASTLSPTTLYVRENYDAIKNDDVTKNDDITDVKKFPILASTSSSDRSNEMTGKLVCGQLYCLHPPYVFVSQWWSYLLTQLAAKHVDWLIFNISAPEISNACFVHCCPCSDLSAGVRFASKQRFTLS